MTTERIRELGKIERTGKIGGVDVIGGSKAVSEDDWTFFSFAPAKGVRIRDIMDEAKTKLYGQPYLKLPPEIRDFQSVSPTCQSSREGKRHYSFHQTSESFGRYRRSYELHCSMALREGRGTALYELLR